MENLPTSLLAAFPDELIRSICTSLPRLVEVQALCDQAGRPERVEDITAERVRSGRWAVVGSRDDGMPCFVNPKDIDASHGIVALVQPTYRDEPYRLLEDKCGWCGYRTDYTYATCTTCRTVVSRTNSAYSAKCVYAKTDWNWANYDEWHYDLLRECGTIDWSEH
jgi:hypothetical protein